MIKLKFLEDFKGFNSKLNRDILLHQKLNKSFLKIHIELLSDDIAKLMASLIPICFIHHPCSKMQVWKFGIAVV